MTRGEIRGRELALWLKLARSGLETILGWAGIVVAGLVVWLAVFVAWFIFEHVEL